MNLFVTGASGWIGSHTVAELIANGHQVTGLARSDGSAEKIAAAGAQVLRGEVTDLDALRAGAASSDGVIHLAFRHDLVYSGDFATAVDSDRAAIELYGEVLAGTDKPLAIASGLAGVQPGVLAVETDVHEPSGGAGGRIEVEQLALSLAERGVRSMSVRFAPTVHGAGGDQGFIAIMVDGDRRIGGAAYVDGADAHWPAVHVNDAASLVRLGVERAPAGSVLHAAAEQGVAVREIAETIGTGLGLPLTAIDEEQAAESFGFIGHFMGRDMQASSALTRELLGWEPTGPTLLEDLRAGAYFTPVPTAR